MGLLRLLILILVVALVLRWVLRALRPPAAKPEVPSAEDYQKLTRCEVCGTHILPPAAGARAICERCRSA